MGNLGYRFAMGAVVLCSALVTLAQETNDGGGLRIETPGIESSSETKVTTVYGISAEDYLPSVEELKKQARPNIRSAASRPSFDLPDAFYFIGGPVFALLFIRVLVIFLNEFEEKRREEQRRASVETPNPD